MAKLSQRFRFNLANPLTSDIKLLTHFLQGVIRIHINTKSHP